MQIAPNEISQQNDKKDNKNDNVCKIQSHFNNLFQKW